MLPSPWSRYAIAIVAGLLLAASFPNIGIAGLAWIAPALMLAAALGRGGWESFRIGYVAGLAHYLASLYWLLLIPVAWLPILGWLALSAYLALFPAMWVWVMSRWMTSSPAASATDDETRGPSVAILAAMVPQTWVRRILWALSGAALWVALEMVVARMFSGFPWNLLGASQYSILPLIQIASFTGVYGVSFLVAWVSLSLLSAAAAILRSPTLRSAWLPEIILPLLAVVAAFSFGFRQLAPTPGAERTVTAALIQPSIPQTMIWNPDANSERFRELLRLSELALAEPADLLIWPEAAIPNLMRYDQETFDAVTGIAQRHRVWMIVGADDAEPRSNAPPPDNVAYYNSSFLISPQGVLAEKYRKRSLVIFGEYVPLSRSLPFLRYLTPIQGGFTPGDGPVPFRLPDGVTATVLICFEDVFPHHSRHYVDEDTDFLVNLTNNGWFKESAAQWQHAASAIFRAVENGVPLVRCSNNGLTCLVDARGRLLEVFRDDRGTIYGPGFLRMEIPIATPADRSLTFYTRHGDVFGWACVGFAGLVVVLRSTRRR
jgi:apolipoprotein N-acyltransferase